MKCDIVGKEDNYKYLVALYTHHFRERFTFTVFFSCKSVFGQFTTRGSSFHSYAATWCEYDNVEVKEKSVMCHASYPSSRGPSILLDLSRKIEGPLLAGYMLLKL